MKLRKILSIALACALLLALCACGAAAPAAPAPTEAPAPEPTEAPAPEPTEAPAPAVVVTDMTGREIMLDEPATRIVALTASDCEILCAIGAGDALVGRGEYCDYPAEVLDVPSVQSGYDTNIEQIIALEPQVLLMATMAQTPEQIEALEAAGVKVVVSDAHDIEGVYTAIGIIGQLMGKEDNAAALVEEMRQGFDALAAEATGDGTQTVYFEISPLEWGLWTAGSNTFMNEIAEMLGMKNIFADLDGWASISEEQVLERNPDYILTVTMYFGEGPTPTEEIMGRAGWENVSAVQNGNVFMVNNDAMTRPGPRLVQGAQEMFDYIYGEAAAENAA